MRNSVTAERIRRGIKVVPLSKQTPAELAQRSLVMFQGDFDRAISSFVQTVDTATRGYDASVDAYKILNNWYRLKQIERWEEAVNILRGLRDKKDCAK